MSGQFVRPSDKASGQSLGHDEKQSSTSAILSIRNLLLFVATLLTLGVILLSISQLIDARAVSHRAEQSQVINDAIDNITQLKLAVSAQRTIYGSLYGSPEIPDSGLLRQGSIQTPAVEGSYDNIILTEQELPEFEGSDLLFDAFKDKYNIYLNAIEIAESDLQAPLEGRSQKIGTFFTALNEVIDAAAELRAGYETNFELGDAATTAVFRLKRELWSIIEYAGREASIIGRHIPDGSPIDPDFELPLLGEYSGRVRGSWDRVRAIASSNIVTEEIKALIDDIESTFFSDFTFEKDDIYYASSEGDDYGITIEEWVKKAQTATEPINKMVSTADAFARTLNEETSSTAFANVFTAIIILIVAAIVGLAGILIVLLRVIAPIKAISSTMDILASGNLEVDIPFVDKVDEIGAMARSVSVFKNNELDRQRLAEEQRKKEEITRKREEEAERRKLQEEEERRTQREKEQSEAREARRADMLQLADRFEASVMAVVEQLSSAATEMEGAARGLTDNAESTMTNSEIVAQAASAANANAQMVASAAEELSASVREITGQTNQSSASARDAVTRTEEASRDIAELASAAQKIGDVVNLINDIAEQTNLLALNATIEAARAGDAGKGFAVVASEVKSLANQTASATSEISQQVEGMQTATNMAVNAMKHIQAVIREIDTTAVSIASAVEEQDASTQEIARNVSEVSTGTEEVTSNIQQVNHGATQTGAAANEVLSAAQALSSQAGELRTEVSNFLTNVRESG